ncbi:MAG: uncharacterized protein QG620_290 [Patescibacteria group bacterium]|nr:uncharacterized protein [Patescibacteria group bacterium]
MANKISNTFSWTNPDVEVRAVAKKEKGVFAKNDIKKGVSVAVFGGYVMSVREEQKLHESIRDNAVQIDDDLVLGIKRKTDIEVACYFNHSCNPNTGFKGQTFLVAMRDIKKNEQVTFDYGMVLFQSSKGIDYEFECSCGEKNCRKIVSNNDWKIRKLQKKYRGYFQQYLEDKIKNKK